MIFILPSLALRLTYGTKASIVATKDSGVIVGVASHSKNEHDSKTLEAALISANKTRTTAIKEVICDRGYRGIKEVLGTIISIPGIIVASGIFAFGKKIRLYHNSLARIDRKSVV